MLLIQPGELWFGSGQALDAVLQFQARLLEAFHDLDARPRASLIGTAPETSLPYQLLDGIAVINISGPLINSAAWLDDYGYTTYSGLQNRLNHAASNADVKQIVMTVHSGGGSVAGVADTGELIRHINDHIKPVIAYSDGAMYSAAYWLGSSAGQVYLSKTGECGSVGVLQVHMDMSKFYEQRGMAISVLREGEYKALLNPYEPLTDKAREAAQAGLRSAYAVFVQHVADHRGVSYPVADARMAQGRQFHGTAAHEAGLVDGILSFNELMNQLHSAAPSIAIGNFIIDNRSHNRNNEALTNPSIHAMSEPTSPPDATPPTATDLPAENDFTSWRKLFTDELTRQAELRTSVRELEQCVADLQAQVDLAWPVVVASAEQMRVAFGHVAGGLDGVGMTELIGLHQQAAKDFQQRFPAGGVAAIPQPEQANAKPAVAHHHQRRVNATYFKK